jgi:hypothetical protein
VFDGDMPSQLTADLVLMLVDAQTGAEPVEHLNDLRRPLLRQQIDLQIEMIPAIGNHSNAVLHIVPTNPPTASVMASLRERGRSVSLSTRMTFSTFSATDAGAWLVVLLMASQLTAAGKPGRAGTRSGRTSPLAEVASTIPLLVVWATHEQAEREPVPIG